MQTLPSQAIFGCKLFRPVANSPDRLQTHPIAKDCLPGLSLRLPSCLSRLPKFAKPLPKFAKPMFIGGYLPLSRGDPIDYTILLENKRYAAKMSNKYSTGDNPHAACPSRRADGGGPSDLLLMGGGTPHENGFGKLWQRFGKLWQTTKTDWQTKG